MVVWWWWSGGSLVWWPYEIISNGVMSSSLHLVLLLLVLILRVMSAVGDPLLAKKNKHKIWTCMPWLLHYESLLILRN